MSAISWPPSAFAILFGLCGRVHVRARLIEWLVVDPTWGFEPAFHLEKKKRPLGRFFLFMAERGGFEPPVRLHAQRFSRPPHSTALPPLRIVIQPLRFRG